MNRPSAISVEQEEPVGFTADEFEQMIDAGAFASIAGKIELIEGVIVRMSPANSPHFMYQRQLFLKLHALFGEGRNGFIVGQEPTVRIGRTSVREPDIAIIRKPERVVKELFAARDLLLAAEVSDTTLAEDRGARRRSFAKAGVPNYWVIDINGRKSLCWSLPKGGDYEREFVVPFGEPLAVPGTDETITLEALP